jgi:hypothetical protein
MKITPAIHSTVTSLLPRYSGNVQVEPTATLIQRAAKKRKKLAAALKAAEASLAALNQAEETLAAFGIYPGHRNPRIDDEEVFARTTGVPFTTTHLEGSRSFLKRLAQATPEQGVTMLREIGIDWTSPEGKLKA